MRHAVEQREAAALRKPIEGVQEGPPLRGNFSVCDGEMPRDEFNAHDHYLAWKRVRDRPHLATDEERRASNIAHLFDCWRFGAPVPADDAAWAVDASRFEIRNPAPARLTFRADLAGYVMEDGMSVMSSRRGVHVTALICPQIRRELAALKNATYLP